MLSKVLIAFVRQIYSIDRGVVYVLESTAVSCSSDGSEWTLSFWSETQFGQGCEVKLQAVAIGGLDVFTSGDFSVSRYWTQYPFTFPVSDSAYNIYLIDDGCADNIFLDDWSFAPAGNGS
jgi:hypothetical protein